MRKNNVRSFVVIAILGVLVVVGAYMFISGKIDMGNFSNDKNATTNGPKGEVKFLNTKKDGTVITQYFKANLNGQELPINIVYTYENTELSAEEKATTGYNRIEHVIGKFGDIVIFDHYERNNNTTQRAQLFDTQLIDKEYNLNYLKVVRGTDGKDYLTMATHIYDGLNAPSENFLYILNDKLQTISNVFDDLTTCTNEKKTMMIHPGSRGIIVTDKAWYSNQYGYNNRGKLFISVKVEDDKIYYLYHNIDSSVPGKFGTLEERIYTIKDDKLEYTINKEYDATSVTGKQC